MYKLSYYVISTPISEGDPCSKRIIFSTRTSEALIMSSDVHEKLQNERFKDLSKEYLDLLLEKKFVVPEDENELLTIVNENKEVINNENLLYEVIQPSAMCQLGCDYCGQIHEKRNTSDKVAQLVFERIEKKLRSNPKFRGLKIGWFGGEPLMALGEIRKMTAKLKALAAELNITYSAKFVTNGLSLKPKIFVELAKELNVTSLEITLDGTGEFHDLRRHTKEGGSTFQYIFKNLLDIVRREDYHELGCSISIRCNVDRRNYQGVVPLIKLLAENKLQDKISHFYVASVYSWGNDAHLKSFSKDEFAQMEI